MKRVKEYLIGEKTHRHIRSACIAHLSRLSRWDNIVVLLRAYRPARVCADELTNKPKAAR